MTITRVERVVYGVADLGECSRFFTDFGLQRLDGNRFGTQTGQVVELRAADDPALPPAVEDGSTIREIVWGVDSAKALGRLAAELASDSEVTAAAGEVHAVDETGFGVGLTVSAPSPWNGDRPGLNRTGAENRWNEPVEHPGRVRPIRLCHVALNVPKAGKAQAVAFYTERLGFVPTGSATSGCSCARPATPTTTPCCSATGPTGRASTTRPTRWPRWTR